MQHGKGHDNRQFHNLGKTTRRHGERAIDAEDRVPPPEPQTGEPEIDSEEAEPRQA